MTCCCQHTNKVTISKQRTYNIKDSEPLYYYPKVHPSIVINSSECKLVAVGPEGSLLSIRKKLLLHISDFLESPVIHFYPQHPCVAATLIVFPFLLHDSLSPLPVPPKSPANKLPVKVLS